MSVNTFGHLFRVTTWGESHGPALGATVDGCPPGIPLTEADDPALARPPPPGAEPLHHPAARGRRGRDPVGHLRGADDRHADPADDPQHRPAVEGLFGEIAETFRPGHADITYHQKYGLRDPRGGGRSSARETAARVAAGGVARAVLAALAPGLTVQGYMVQMGRRAIDRARFDAGQIAATPSGAPMPRPPRPGPRIWTRCARPAIRWAR
jgi:chorismate synthase